MRAAFANRAARRRAGSIHTVPPAVSSSDYSQELAAIAATILYQTPLPAPSQLPLYILNGTAFPEASEVDYSALLPYVLARLPGEDDLLAGADYEIVFFAGGQSDSIASRLSVDNKRDGPSIAWYLQAYHVLSRATRKRLQRLYIVHERSWVRVLIEVFGTIVSPKFTRKITHVNNLGGLCVYLPLQDLLIPPSVYLHDRRIAPEISLPHANSRRAFGAPRSLPSSIDTGNHRLPRVLRETTVFLCQGNNLNTEGIFRISAHSQYLAILREAYDRGQRFIVWKEPPNAAFVDPGMTTLMLSDIADSHTYSLPLAASLIKTWYRELQSPIFPDTCYDQLIQFHATHDINEVTRNLESISRLVSPSSDSSFLSRDTRLILSWHLLPMLSLVTQHARANKMTADNLAICFAPTLVNGADPMVDSKVFPIVRTFLRDAVVLWTHGLHEACKRTDDDFMRAIQPPPNLRDYEDPIPHARDNLQPQDTKQKSHIIMMIDSDENGTAQAPPLPERSSSLPLSKINSKSHVPPPVPRRKPAPGIKSDVRATSSGSTKSSRGMIELLCDADDPDLHPSKTNTGLLATPASNVAPEVRRKPVSPHALGPIPTLSEIQTQSSQLRSVSNNSTKSVVSSATADNDDALFVKPTWAASSRKTSAASSTVADTTSVAVRKASLTSSVRSTSPVKFDSATAGDDNTRTSAQPYIGRPRAPSPGLLQRMQSWEQHDGGDVAPVDVTNGIARPSSLVSSRSQSVDDIKRLYEERLATATSLGNAAALAVTAPRVS